MQFIIKRTKSHRIGLMYHFLITTCGFSCLIAYTAVFKWSPLAFFFCFFFGLMDSSSCTHFGMIFGAEFDGKVVNAFGFYNMLKALTIGIMVFIESDVDKQWEFLTLFCVSFALYLSSYVIVFIFFPFKKMT